MGRRSTISTAPVIAGDFVEIFFEAEDGIRDLTVTGVQTCALPISGYVAGCAIAPRVDLRSDRRNRRAQVQRTDRKSTRLNSSHSQISYAVFCLKKKNEELRREVESLLDVDSPQDQFLSSAVAQAAD